MQKIVAPTNCPSCNSTLEQVNDQLFCRNSDCESKQYKVVEHFAKTLKIKGLGPATIQRLGLTSIVEIYELDLPYMTEILGERTAVKLAEEINKSKQASLNQLLPAFGISLIGQSATDKICQVVSELSEITSVTAKEAGWGPKAIDNYTTWYETQFLPNLSHLDFSFKTEKKNIGTKGVVCITGKLVSYKTKSAAKIVLEERGYIVKDSVTKDVTILVNESGVESEKTKKARASGLTIVTKIDDLR